jgi:hypothetical protein
MFVVEGQVRASHAAGLEHVGEAAFEQLAPAACQGSI